MRRYIAIVCMLLLCVVHGMAVNIPAGTFYFDNSKTQYAHVKFVYGVDNANSSCVVSMKDEGNNIWSVTFDATIKNQYRYTFADTSLEDGAQDKTFSDLKEYISKTLNEKRTATTDQTIPVGGTFVPTSSDNWASGSWQGGTWEVNDVVWSETLPVLFINTASGSDVASRDVYEGATCWLDPLDTEACEALGSKDEPLSLQIRGRGNWTWRGFNKKPYRLKLDVKAPLGGLNSARNFCLMARADDNLGFMRDELGFELSRRLKLAWTPEDVPVEVVINGKYQGLYFLTEPIRVGKRHVDILEQEDLCEDAESVSGGWLVEIDNYSEDGQVTMQEGNGEKLMFTMHSPEVLSSVQRSYITEQLTQINSLVYATDKSSQAWEKVIDKDQLVRYYLVQELMEDTESFHGSCFFYKDAGVDALWKWGPVWDFGNAFQMMADRFIYDQPQFAQYWIAEMSKWQSFQTYLRRVWDEFLVFEYPTLCDWIEERAMSFADAAVLDAARWPDYGNANMKEKAQKMQERVKWRMAWLTQQWGNAEGIDMISDNGRHSRQGCYDMQGRPCSLKANGHGIYIVNGKKIMR